MATSRQFQHAETSKPRTYITTNLNQRHLSRQPTPTPHPIPNPDAPINRDRDANGNPGWWSRLKFDSPRDRVQPKLTVGAPNDQYEQEADRVADEVMSMPDAATQPPVQREGMPEEELQAKPLATAITPLVQRETLPEEEPVQAKTSGNADIQREAMPEEEEVETKPLASGTLQREAMAPEEEDLQMKPLGTADLQREALPEEDEPLQTKQSPTPHSPLPTPSLESQLFNTQGSGNPLPNDVRSFMEPRFGADFSQVRVHTGSDAVQMNRDLNAQAFTHKQDVYFGAGKIPGNDALTAHELTHVVQQIGTQNHIHLRNCGYDPIGNSAPAKNMVSARQINKQLIQRVSQKQDLYQPITENAPAKAISIGELITLVEQEESKYPLEEQIDTTLMITRLRKIFYNSKGWDEYLIPGAKDISAPYTTQEYEKGRETVDVPGPFNLEVVRKGYKTLDSEGDEPEISKNQEVRLEDGNYLDIGHVFAGLDALAHPSQVDGPGTININSNVDAVTWVGDLGSVLAEIQFKFINQGNSITVEECQEIINEYASPQDMLGNIDAYVINSGFILDSNPHRKVSEILREYYLSEHDSLREHRYSVFCKSIGLEGWNGSSFENESEWVENYADEVNDAAALYVAASTEGLAKYPFALGMSGNPEGERLVRLFLNALKVKISTESPIPED